MAKLEKHDSKTDKSKKSYLNDLSKNGTSDSPLGYGIAGGIMIIAGIIWIISTLKSGSDAYVFSALLCLGIGGYCLFQMVKILRSGKEKKEEKR